MPIERLSPSFSFDEERLKELKKIAPEAFADGKINWGILKETLGEYLEDDSGEVEHFGLFWPGKKEARRIAAMPSKGTLLPVYGEGLKADGTPDTDGVNDSNNIFIEGENLEVLKILQKSYAGRIKMIYIDPPYNTGNDFIYDDDFSEPLDEYLRRTGQIDGEGKPLTTNRKADGRFHSKWLSMIYPRLKLSRNLLRDDGAIFVSIDDNEIHNLRSVMNEIYGEENFIATIIWQHSIQPKGYLGKFSVHHNYIVIYSKTEEFSLGSLIRTDEHNKNYTNPDNDPNGPWRSGDVRNALYRKNLIYEIQTPSGRKILPPPNGWRWSKDTINEKIKSGEIIFNKDETKIIRKIYLNKLEGRTPETIWFGKDVGTTREGIKELKELFNDKAPFDTPKPTKLISQMLDLTVDYQDDDIVLDFFSGSGVTGQSVLDFNVSKKGNLKYILVQLPEPINLETPSGIIAKENNLFTISKVARKRLTRVANAKKMMPLDKGFKFFTLDSSNFKDWADVNDMNTLELQRLFDDFEKQIKVGSKPENITTEIILLEGFPLDSKIKKLNEFRKNEIKIIASELCEHQLFICLDDEIDKDTIDRLVLGPKDIFICMDSSIQDQDKLRLSDKGLIKTI